jgi:hypothetical protein
MVAVGCSVVKEIRLMAVEVSGDMIVGTNTEVLVTGTEIETVWLYLCVVDMPISSRDKSKTVLELFVCEELDTPLSEAVSGTFNGISDDKIELNTGEDDDSLLYGVGEYILEPIEIVVGDVTLTSVKEIE